MSEDALLLQRGLFPWPPDAAAIVEFRAGAPRSIGVDGNLVECLGCAVSTVAVVEAVALTVVLMLAVVFMDIAMS